MMAPLAIAAALCLATVALAEPPSGWKTCGGLPDNYSNTACDTATTTVSALSIKHCSSRQPSASAASPRWLFLALVVLCSAPRWTGSRAKGSGGAAHSLRPCSARAVSLHRPATPSRDSLTHPH